MKFALVLKKFPRDHRFYACYIRSALRTVTADLDRLDREERTALAGHQPDNRAVEPLDADEEELEDLSEEEMAAKREEYEAFLRDCEFVPGTQDHDGLPQVLEWFESKPS